jgi:hypothetical protein
MEEVNLGKAAVTSALDSRYSENNLMVSSIQNLVNATQQLTASNKELIVCIRESMKELRAGRKRKNSNNVDGQHVFPPPKHRKIQGNKPNEVVCEPRESNVDSILRWLLERNIYKAKYDKMLIDFKRESCYPHVVYAQWRRNEPWWPGALVEYDKLFTVSSEVLASHPGKSKLELELSDGNRIISKKLSDFCNNYFLVYFKFDKKRTYSWCHRDDIMAFKHQLHSSGRKEKSLWIAVQAAILETPKLLVKTP